MKHAVLLVFFIVNYSVYFMKYLYTSSGIKRIVMFIKQNSFEFILEKNIRKTFSNTTNKIIFK